MNKSPLVLLEKTTIFPCQACSRAFLCQSALDKHVAKCNNGNQDMLDFKFPFLPPLPDFHDDRSCVKIECTDLVLPRLASTSKKRKQIKTTELRIKQEPLVLIEIDVEPKKETARLNAPHSNSENRDKLSTIPKESVKQQIKEVRNIEVKKQIEIGSMKGSNAKLTCGQCPKSFKTLKGMTNHLQKHLEPLYQCSQCPKTFTAALKLNKHVYRTHTARHRVCCNICHKEIQNSQNLKIHLRTHTGERPFLCKQCGKRFTQAAALYTHTKIHLGIKEHICSYCNRAFRDYHNMKNHERIHTKERPNECKYCNKAFSDPSALTRHIRTHTGCKIYQCQQCPMKFSDASGLIAHRKRHIGIKNFACSFCGKRFLFRTPQLRHEMAVHTNIKNFECELCKKRFALKQYLRTHIIRSQH